MSIAAAPTDLSVPYAMLELTQGLVVTQALHAAARLRIAEALADGPRTAEEVAATVEAHPGATHRLLRLLASRGVLSEAADGTFGLTPLGETLRADSPHSMRDLALLMGHPVTWEDWGQLTESVRTGQPQLPVLRGMHAFAYMGANPEFGMAFGAGMGNLSGLETDPVVDAYDFGRFGRIVDVGGGAGALLAAVLRQAGTARGVLVDERAEQMGAPALLAGHGAAGRVDIETGGLFDPLPAGADAYLLKHIVHDWPEEQALAILGRVREAVPAGGRVLLMEFVSPAGAGAHPSKLFDLWLLLLVGGRERTEAQYGALLERAGFTLERVVPTASAVSIVEARPR